MKELGIFGRKLRYVTAVDLIKCLKQIKYQRLLLTCTPALPSNTNATEGNGFSCNLACCISYLSPQKTNTQKRFFIIFISTVCLKSHDPFHIVTYYINWVKTSGTHFM